MPKFQTIFMGAPDFAVPALKTLQQQGHRISMVVTQPDRPKGRGRLLSAPPVKIAAQELGLPVIQPESVKTQSFHETMAEHRPDLFVVVALGHILPRRILELAPMGAVNLHASLLPKYRGPAPIQWAIINGETETGVTSMLMDAGLDTGEILLSKKIPICGTDTAGSLHDRLAKLSAHVLADTLEAFAAGTIRPVAQDHGQATYAPLLKKSDGRMDWSRPAEYLERFVRGMCPWPGAHTYWGSKRVNIFSARVVPMSEPRPPGTVLASFSDELRVATGNDALSILELQLASGRRMHVRDFLKGAAISPATVLA
jgi:methionyl-tRNA formyltransferase